MSKLDIQYQALLQDILDNGVTKTDRTETGTISVFGRQIRHKMSDGFPLLTTKKMAFKTMVTELLWFLRGDTNIKYLVDNNCHIWDGDCFANYVRNFTKYVDSLPEDSETEFIINKDKFINKIKTDDEFAQKWGEVGSIYGAGWRRWKTKSSSSVPNTRPLPNLREGVERTYLGVANGKGKEGHLLSKTWEGMIARCYDSNSIEYPNYGACNVYVCDRWLEFKAFAEDVEKLNNWDLKKENPRGYVLDKDGIGTGYLYSLENCQWITPTDNANLKSTKIYTVEKDGIKYTFTNPTSFCNEQNISNKNFSDLWTGAKNAKKRNGFTLVSVEDIKDTVCVDQIANLINDLKTNPDSRRLMVSAWNVGELNQMMLPPCHYSWQVYTRELSLEEKWEQYTKSGLNVEINGTPLELKHMGTPFYPKSLPQRAISLMYNTRSQDVPLGTPFNIASYALLLEIIAKEVNMVPDELITNMGDCHIYLNQIDGIKEQLMREPYELPKLKHMKTDDFYKSLSEDLSLITHLDNTDFVVENYQSHPSIKMPLSN